MTSEGRISVFFSISYPGGLPGQPGAYTTTILSFTDPTQRLFRTIDVLNRTMTEIRELETERIGVSGWRQRRLAVRHRWLTFQRDRLSRRASKFTKQLLERYDPSTLGLQSSWCAEPFTPIVSGHEVRRTLDTFSCGKDVAFATR